LTEPVSLSIVLIDIPPLDEFRDFAYPQLVSPQYEFILKYPDPIDTSGAEKYFITIEEEVEEQVEQVKRNTFRAIIKSVSNLGLMVVELDKDVKPYQLNSSNLNITTVPASNFTWV
jgi:hypothetical protein